MALKGVGAGAETRTGTGSCFWAEGACRTSVWYRVEVTRIQGYKEIQGSKLSMYKHSLANINNRF